MCAILEHWALERCHDVAETLGLLTAEESFGRELVAWCEASRMQNRQCACGVKVRRDCVVRCSDLQRLDKTDIAEESS
ncbi:hypothetical protein PC116_g22668 [Phytophthora cactorum]|nr:hypothetical protein PC116_g22668 [Phytophthora cactorum]